MTKDTQSDEFDHLDLCRLANYMKSLYPQFSEGELVKMLSAVARHAKCTCSLCCPSELAVEP